MMKMKNNIFKTLFLAAAAISFASCSEWTEPESVGFHYTALEEKNPDLYKA